MRSGLIRWSTQKSSNGDWEQAEEKGVKQNMVFSFAPGMAVTVEYANGNRENERTRNRGVQTFEMILL